MNTELPMCPACDVGDLVIGERVLEIRHGSQLLRVPKAECYRCERCGEECVLPHQIRRNQVLIADAKRRADDLLTGGQIRGIRRVLGISQQDASCLFGGGANAFSKYERGETVQSEPMDKLLRVAAVDPNALVVLYAIASEQADVCRATGYRAAGSMSFDDAGYTSRTIQGYRRVVSSFGYQEKRCA